MINTLREALKQKGYMYGQKVHGGGFELFPGAQKVDMVMPLSSSKDCTWSFALEGACIYESTLKQHSLF